MEYFDYSAMQTGEPLARFKKTIVGQVHVVALNPFDEKPEGVLLKGVRNGTDEETYIEIWNDKALAFFTRMNQSHFKAGRLVSMGAPPIPEKSPNEITEEEIDTLLNSPFLSLKNRLPKFTDIAPVLRLLNRARELEKSEKLISHIESTMAAIELSKYQKN